MVVEWSVLDLSQSRRSQRFWLTVYLRLVRPNFGPPNPLLIYLGIFFSIGMSLTGVRQAVNVPSIDIYARS